MPPDALIRTPMIACSRLFARAIAIACPSVCQRLPLGAQVAPSVRRFELFADCMRQGQFGDFCAGLGILSFSARSPTYLRNQPSRSLRRWPSPASHATTVDCSRRSVLCSALRRRTSAAIA